ncbi:helix-hairpin-helix domain-containing protein [Bradyrhizobium sp. WD16]|uniref:ComEA family DNA-binding protein n=1 Tax=Bradyrhizobium sp. WD16 TaxID=1521768 RepID=UPI0020A2703A|nr:helix-hairpin-helix domain-containing protein [Bradyrhizobium sp. WD16]UTD27923.1 hypothetical protein DB459_14370 [Bradyrhizobium sp. WD16]
MTVRLICLGIAMLSAVGALIFGQASSSIQDRMQPSPSKAAPSQRGRLNLNTAAAAELRGLPRLSAGSANAIVEARSKASFKDWDDFAARRVVPSFAMDEIKDRVSF